MGFPTPILFCIYNRPDLTAQVFEVIRRIRPQHLLVLADGPKQDPRDRERVNQTRQIIQKIDWDCRLITHFADKNLGCAVRMASGISWAFEQFEELIILEDDCLPDLTFFPYCQHLLERYRNNSQVMMISGDNFQPKPVSSDSYYFSKWPHIWGWASWRRAWKHFDLEISDWPNWKNRSDLSELCCGHNELKHWEQVFDQTHRGEIDTWDFSWTYSCWRNQGATILPQRNLVRNIGFGADATHTVDSESQLASLKTFPMGKLVHPQTIEIHKKADYYTWESVFANNHNSHSPDVKQNWWTRLTTKASRSITKRFLRRGAVA
ncbi:MAG: glycosyltransferase family 2 protein [Planctomycetota bacterium]